jgi:hypothetical protein
VATQLVVFRVVLSSIELVNTEHVLPSMSTTSAYMKELLYEVCSVVIRNLVGFK